MNDTVAEMEPNPLPRPRRKRSAVVHIEIEIVRTPLTPEREVARREALQAIIDKVVKG